MVVTKLFDLFLLNKIIILILLILFNIVAFFAYDKVSNNYHIELKAKHPISMEGVRLVDHSYFFNKYSIGSVKSDILKGTNGVRYELENNPASSSFKGYFGVMINCGIKENCVTVANSLLDALNNEAKAIIDRKKILNEIAVLRHKDTINNLNSRKESITNKKNTLISTQEDYFELSKENIDEANNLSSLDTMLLLQGINQGRKSLLHQAANIDASLARLEDSIFSLEKEIEYHNALKEVKHLFEWYVEPTIKDVGKQLSLSLWLTLSFLMSIALYFLAAVLININERKK